MVAGKTLELKSFGTIRCFSATTQANTKYLSVRGSRDFATQIHYWSAYRERCDQAKQPYGRYVTPQLAEHVSGLPPGWSSPDRGAVQKHISSFLPWCLENSKVPKLQVVSLFSGILGLDLAVTPWVEPLCFVEKDTFCKQVIAARVAEGHFESKKIPIYDDVESFQVSTLKADRIHGFMGGFPCQGVSRAGLKQGMDDSRSSLRKHFFRLFDQAMEEGKQPQFMLMENVSNILSKDLHCIMQFLLREVEARGLCIRWLTLQGHHVGAPVFRERTFFLVHVPGCNIFEGFNIAEKEELQAWPTFAWHLQSKPPLERWLQEQSSQTDKDRLKACGNLVMPDMGFMAVSLLAHGS